MTERTTERTLYVVGASLAGIWLLTPVAYMLLTAMSVSPDFLAPDGKLALTFSNFYQIMTTPSLRFLDYLRNSLIVSALAATLCVGVAAMAAYAIARIRFPGAMAVMLAVLAISMFPQICVVGYLFRLMSALGWINTYPGLLLPYIAWITPLSLWVLVSYFSRIPRELDTAARVDGCGHWRTMVFVLLPVAAPGLFSTGLLAFIFAFNEFMFALMLTTGHEARTVPVGIALFEGLHGRIPWGTIMAASALTTAPVTIVTLAFQRYIVQGLTRGAVKG